MAKSRNTKKDIKKKAKQDKKHKKGIPGHPISPLSREKVNN
jgi:hypothetical protein